MTPLFRVEGMAEWLGALADLRQSVAGNILGKGLRRALRPVRDMARQKAARSAKQRDPQLQSGLMAKAIAVKISPARGAYPSGKVVGMVGVERGHHRVAGVITRGPHKGATWYQNPAKYFHLVEFGTARSAARPFLRPALAANQQQIVETIRDVIAEELTKIAGSGKWKSKLRSGNLFNSWERYAA